MIYLESFLYYIFLSSTLLFYGVGINRVAEIGFKNEVNITFYVKFILSIFITAVLAWLVTYCLLLPIGLIELFPITTFLIYVCINTFLEALVRITTGKSCSEFILSFAIILLSIFESSSILNTILICASCLGAILIMCPFIVAFKKRVYPNEKYVSEKYYADFFIFLAIMVIIFSVWDISWLNFGDHL